MIKHPTNRRERLELKYRHEKKSSGVRGSPLEPTERLDHELEELSISEAGRQVPRKEVEEDRLD